jgi:hypothetical protein
VVLLLEGLLGGFGQNQGHFDGFVVLTIRGRNEICRKKERRSKALRLCKDKREQQSKVDVVAASTTHQHRHDQLQGHTVISSGRYFASIIQNSKRANRIALSLLLNA